MKKIMLIGIMMLLLSSLVAAYSPSMTYSVNPCISQKWANGTPLKITITGYACNKATDPWNYCDKVKAKAIIYFGDGWVQEDETYWGATWYNSHTEFVFTDWNTNKTGNFTMSLSVKSNDTAYTANYTYLDYEVVNKTYYDDNNWSQQYVWYGDCVTTGIVGGPAVIGDGGDAITRTLEGADDEWGWGTTLMWFLLMIIVGGAMLFFGGSMGVIAVGIVELCLLLIGMYLGFMPAWILYLLIFGAIMVVGLKVYKMIGGN